MGSQALSVHGKKTLLLRIPNASEEEPSRISIDTHRTLTIRELCRDIQNAPHDECETFLRDLIPNLFNLSQSELFLLCETLLSLRCVSSLADSNLIDETLRALITNHIDLLECVSLGAQVVRFCGNDHANFSSPIKTLVGTLIERLNSMISDEGPDTPSESIDQQQVLLRCLETYALRPTTITIFLHLLNNRPLESVKEQKSICKQILQVARRISDTSAALDDLKRQASTIYITGENFGRSNLIPPPTSESSHSSGEARAAILIEKIVASDGKSEVQRLLAQDFHALRCISGLEIDRFSVLTSRLLPRAIAEPWARAALLDIVRAPHAASVNLSNRTNVLGVLVAEARRHGILDQDMEQEILATSARLPHNPGGT